MANISKELLLEGQGVHFISLVCLLFAVYGSIGIPGVSTGRFLGIATSTWIILAIGEAVLHQCYVWVCWRLQLHGSYITRWFGARAFNYYCIIFVALIILRPVLLFMLGWANRNTLNINIVFGYSVALALFLPFVYMIYSVRYFFTFRRAFGIDHFEKPYRNRGLVRRGIFRWTPNAMYLFGFLALWIPAFLFQSVAALVVAAFSHAYIWIHYFATEKPDMVRIYGNNY